MLILFETCAVRLRHCIAARGVCVVLVSVFDINFGWCGCMLWSWNACYTLVLNSCFLQISRRVVVFFIIFGVRFSRSDMRNQNRNRNIYTSAKAETILLSFHRPIRFHVQRPNYPSKSDPFSSPLRPASDDFILLNFQFFLCYNFRFHCFVQSAPSHPSNCCQARPFQMTCPLHTLFAHCFLSPPIYALHRRPSCRHTLVDIPHCEGLRLFTLVDLAPVVLIRVFETAASTSASHSVH